MTKLFNKFKFFKITLILTFIMGIFFTSCKKDKTPPPPPADKTELQATITSAQAIFDASIEGTKPGQHEVGSKAPFKTVLDAAKAVSADPNATQAAVTNANAQLKAAMDAYQARKINEISAANLIGFWKMNGNAGDSSGKNNHGVLKAGHAYYGAGMPTLTTDRFGRANMAYFFDKGGNIEVPYSSALNPQQMTISLWAKWSATGRTINADTYTFVAMNRWNGYKFQLQSSHLPFYTVKVVRSPGDTTIYDRDDAGIALAENTWHHVAVTFKSNEMKFYIDGDLVTTWPTALGDGPVPGTALTLPNPINFVIGQDLPTSVYTTVEGDFYVNWGGFFTGDMDDVMFYNVALDGPQVKSIYDNQKTL